MKQFSKTLTIILLLLLLTACELIDPAIVQENPTEAPTAIAEAPTSAPTATAALPTATPVEPTATAVPPTEVPPTEVPPTEVPPEAPNPEPVASNCLICHSDQQTLINVASPIEEPEESESSGVG